MEVALSDKPEKVDISSPAKNSVEKNRGKIQRNTEKYYVFWFRSSNLVFEMEQFICGGAAACVAEVVTLPIDTLKVRLQLLRKSGGTGMSMSGMFHKVVAEEGVGGLYKGVVPALQRQMVFASLRVGIYREISERLKEPGQQTLSLGRKVLAGLASGAIGITCVA